MQAINATVQKNLRKLKDDCDRVVTGIVEAARADKEKKSLNKRNTFKASLKRLGHYLSPCHQLTPDRALSMCGPSELPLDPGLPIFLSLALLTRSSMCGPSGYHFLPAVVSDHGLHVPPAGSKSAAQPVSAAEAALTRGIPSYPHADTLTREIPSNPHAVVCGADSTFNASH